MSSTVKTDLKSDDYYQVLGVKKDATEKELTKAYRKAAMKWHPDRHQDESAKAKAETNFKKIGEAYTVLKDPKTRETYDRFGKAGLQGGGPPPSGSAGGFPGAAPGGGGGFQMSQEQAEALFRNLFGGAGGGASMGGGSPGNVQFVFSNGGPGGPSRRSASAGGNPFGGASMGGNPFGGASMGGSPFGGASMGGSPFGGASAGGGGAFDLSDLLGGLGGLGGGAKRGNPFGGRCGAPKADGPLENRTQVTIHGLKGQAQFNGKPGVVVGYDPSSGRHMVALASNGGQKTISVKPQNLVQRVRVTVRGLKSGAEHNGKTADVTGVNPSGDRYVCEVGPQRKVMALKPENVVVPSGTRVRISGLKAAPQWNGRWSQVESFVGGSKRYRVRLLDEPSKKLDLKPGNVRL